MKSISVIIPMYNAQNTIVKCIESVFNQTYTGKTEIIVVNDGSVDNSRFIVEELIINNKTSINIKLINKENGGVSSARNAGLKEAKGDWIALLDADDIWMPNKLEVQFQVILKKPEIDFLGCSRNNEILRILGKKIKNIHKANVKELLIKMYPQTSTAIFRKKLFEQFGGYNEAMTHGEDGDLWIKYCANSNFYYIPDSLVITGEGKPSFGYSGLSANLEAMEKGVQLTLKEAKQQQLITGLDFYIFYIFYKIKYLRRILITKTRNYGL